MLLKFKPTTPGLRGTVLVSKKELSTENKELKDELNELKIFIKKKLGDE